MVLSVFTMMIIYKEINQIFLFFKNLRIIDYDILIVLYSILFDVITILEGFIFL